MAGPLKIAAVLLCGAALGLAATAWVLHADIDPAAVEIGAWVISPKAGTPAINPYARAHDAYAGRIALAAAEGLAFTATRDETGRTLSTSCVYRLAGRALPARYWTLTATTAAGSPMSNGADRTGFVSTDIVRRDDGSFVIVASPSARPGNWLPVSGTGRFVLTLRLYDTPLASTVGGIGKAALPTLTRTGCPS